MLKVEFLPAGEATIFERASEYFYHVIMMLRISCYHISKLILCTLQFFSPKILTSNMHFSINNTMPKNKIKYSDTPLLIIESPQIWQSNHCIANGGKKSCFETVLVFSSFIYTLRTYIAFGLLQNKCISTHIPRKCMPLKITYVSYTYVKLPVNKYAYILFCGRWGRLS